MHSTLTQDSFFQFTSFEMYCCDNNHNTWIIDVIYKVQQVLVTVMSIFRLSMCYFHIHFQIFQAFWRASFAVLCSFVCFFHYVDYTSVFIRFFTFLLIPRTPVSTWRDLNRLLEAHSTPFYRDLDLVRWKKAEHSDLMLFMCLWPRKKLIIIMLVTLFSMELR